MKIASWAVVLVFAALGRQAVASDWKYAGYVSGYGPGAKEAVAFYDADSVTRDGALVRYWVKAIPVKTLEDFPGPAGKKKFKDHVEFTANKIESGYMPPLLMRTSFRKHFESQRDDFTEFMVTVVGWEVAANRGAQHTATLLFEIDCNRKAIRSVDATLYDKNGNPKRDRLTRHEWSFITPDTNAAWQSELMCPK